MTDIRICKEITLVECGREKCIPEKQICSHPKNFHLFHCVIHGKGRTEIGGKRYVLNRGDIFYIKNNTSANYAPDPTDPWTYVWVGFDGLIVDDVLAKCGVSEQVPIIRDTPAGDLRRIFQTIYEMYDKGRRFDFACLGMFYVLLNTIDEITNGRGKDRDGQGGTQKDRHIAEACEYISNNYQFPITVVDIAASVGLSPNYLANMFAERLGTSPKQYLTKYRMDKACIYLKLSDYSIKEISQSVGYANQLHFSSEFRRVMNMSPSEYREANSVGKKTTKN